MRLDKQDRAEDHDRNNGRKIRPPVFDTSMNDGERTGEKANRADDRPPDKGSNNRLTKAR